MHAVLGEIALSYFQGLRAERSVRLLKMGNERVDQVAAPVAWAEGVTVRTRRRRRLGHEAASCDTLFQAAGKYPSLRARP
jgi:hypothetical protein